MDRYIDRMIDRYIDYYLFIYFIIIIIIIIIIMPELCVPGIAIELIDFEKKESFRNPKSSIQFDLK